MNNVKLYYHLMQNGNSYFAYDFNKHVMIRLEKDIYEILSMLLYSNMSLDDVHSIIVNSRQLQMYKSAGIFFYSNELEEKGPELISGNTAYFSFPTTHSCNLRCKYCFAEHGNNYAGKIKNFNKGLIEDIFEFMYNDYYKDCVKYRLDFVSGGEPFLNIDLIKDTVEIAERFNKKLGKKLVIFLCTNGTIDSKESWDLLNKYNINIGISIDGEKEVHNLVRVYEDGTGGYEDTLNTIKSILKTPHYSEHTKAIWGLSVVTSKTASLKNILLHNKSIGIKHMQMKLVRTDKKNDLAINWDNYRNLLLAYKELSDYFVQCASKHDYTDLKMILNDNDYFGKLMCRILDGGRIYRRCLAGINKVSFDAMGNIYPCDSFVGNMDFLMGNIYKGINSDIPQLFKKGTVFVRSKCKSCWAKYLCGGDCFHNSYLANGNLFEPDPVFCEINQKLLEYALNLYFIICSNGDLENLKNFIKIKKRLNS